MTAPSREAILAMLRKVVDGWLVGNDIIGPMQEAMALLKEVDAALDATESAS